MTDEREYPILEESDDYVWCQGRVKFIDGKLYQLFEDQFHWKAWVRVPEETT